MWGKRDASVWEGGREVFVVGEDGWMVGWLLEGFRVGASCRVGGYHEVIGNVE
jgi:hypothetical protein